MIAYWVMTGIIWGPYSWIFEHSPKASQGVVGTIKIETYSNPEELAISSIPWVINNLHFLLFIGISGYAIVTLLQDEERLSGRQKLAILSFLAGSVFYVPNPLWIPLRGVGALERWGIVVLPFIAIIPAIGILNVARNHRRGIGKVGAGALIFLFVFISLSSGFTDPSITDLSGIDKGERKYFTDDNIRGANYVLSHTKDSEVYSSASMSSYLQYEEWKKTGGPSPESTPDSRFNVTQYDDNRDIVLIDEGLTLVEYNEFTEKESRYSIVNLTGEAYDGNVTVIAPVSSDEGELRSSENSIVYSHQDTFVLYK